VSAPLFILEDEGGCFVFLDCLGGKHGAVPASPSIEEVSAPLFILEDEGGCFVFLDCLGGKHGAVPASPSDDCRETNAAE